ncbi:MAG: hypothetical protein ACKVP0_19475 [Pirellulaceae bacterium]
MSEDNVVGAEILNVEFADAKELGRESGLNRLKFTGPLPLTLPLRLGGGLAVCRD